MSTNLNTLNNLYYWVNGDVVVGNWDGTSVIHHGAFCVDNCENQPLQRYGRFKRNPTMWEHVPLEYFPKEFRLQLLLLGVP